jgi:hypothetical protein
MSLLYDRLAKAEKQLQLYTCSVNMEASKPNEPFDTSV